jgi:hypothetical protein
MQYFICSPAFYYLFALILEVLIMTTNATLYNTQAAAIVTLVCSSFFPMCLLAYSTTLVTDVGFPLALALRCIFQAIASDLSLGALIVLALYKCQRWDTWLFFSLFWAITLFVDLVHDVVFTGLLSMRRPI